MLDANMILLILIGLPESGREHVMECLFQHCLRPDVPFNSIGEYNEKGLSFYELAVLGKSRGSATADPFVWSLFTKSSGYLYCFLSALVQYSKNVLDQPFCLYLTDVRKLNTQFFKSRVLNDHFLAIYEHLMWNYVRCGHVPFTDAKLLEGLTLVNIWDISWNKAVMHFLCLLVGHLDRSFPVLMFDLNKHGKKLKEPVAFKKSNLQQSNAKFLLQFAHLGEGSKGRKNVSTVAAVVNPEVGSEQREEANQVIRSEALHLRVQHLIQDEVWFVSDHNVGVLKNKIEEYIIGHEETFVKVPLSWILLRSAYFKTGQMYIKKSELQTVAEELGIGEESFENFLLTFASQGSIVYIPGVETLENYVILNPFDFCYRLNELFEPRFNGDFRKGLVFGSYFHRLFGNDAKFFMEVLTSSGMAVELMANRVLYEADEQLTTMPTSDRQCLFIPTIRDTEMDESKADAPSLYIHVRSEMEICNFPVHMVRKIMGIESVFFIPSSISNMTTFCTHQGNVFELRCDIRACDAQLKRGLASAVSKALESSKGIGQPVSNTHPDCLTTLCVNTHNFYHSVFGATDSQICGDCKLVYEAWRAIL